MNTSRVTRRASVRPAMMQYTPAQQQQGPGVALPALQRRLRRYSKTACPASGEHAAESLAPDKTTKNLCTPRSF